MRTQSLSIIARVHAGGRRDTKNCQGQLHSVHDLGSVFPNPLQWTSRMDGGFSWFTKHEWHGDFQYFYVDLLKIIKYLNKGSSGKCFSKLSSQNCLNIFYTQCWLWIKPRSCQDIIQNEDLLPSREYLLFVEAIYICFIFSHTSRL